MKFMQAFPPATHIDYHEFNSLSIILLKLSKKRKHYTAYKKYSTQYSVKMTKDSSLYASHLL